MLKPWSRPKYIDIASLPVELLTLQSVALVVIHKGVVSRVEAGNAVIGAQAGLSAKPHEAVTVPHGRPQTGWRLQFEIPEPFNRGSVWSGRFRPIFRPCRVQDK